MKKTLLFLVPNDSSYLYPIKKAFEDLGWRVKNYDYRRGSMVIRILRFIPIIGGFNKAKTLIENEILSLNSKLQPGLILVIKGETLTSKLINGLKSKNNKVINWFPDPMAYWDVMAKIVSDYDIFFHFDKFIIKKLIKISKNKILYLPFAAEISNENVNKKKYDISFVGTYLPYRKKILSSLKKFKLNIWGDSRWFKSSLKQFVRGGRIHQNKMKQIIRLSKINLNVYYDFYAEGSNLRTFEVTGTGGFLLSEYIKDLKNLFKIGKEIVCFSSTKELIQKVKFYLERDRLREAIASAGFKRAQQEHDYYLRIKQMLRLIIVSNFIKDEN